MAKRPYIRVEYYRATEEDIDKLVDYLSVSEAVEDISFGAAKKASGVIELGTSFVVFLKPILETYAATKLLDIVYDDVKAWFKKKGKRGQCITVSKSNGKKKKIGRGKPRRYR